MVLEAQDVRVRQNPALGVKEECITSLTCFQMLDVIGCHGVQQTRAVLASELDFAAARQIEPRRRFPELFVSCHGSLTTGLSDIQRR